MGEYCDHSGDEKERDEGENPLQMLIGTKSPMGETVECWDLVEVNKSRTEDGGKEMALDQIVPRATKAEGELSWEKSDLAKFSNSWDFRQRVLKRILWTSWLKFVREGKEFIAKPCWRNLNSREN